MLSLIKKAFKQKKRSVRGVLTLLFVNINNFVGLSEIITPEDVVDMLRSYIDLCEDIIIKNGGNIVLIEGDCILSAFAGDDEDKVLSCIDSSLDIINEIPKNEAITKYFKSDEFSIVVSLSQGECVYESKGDDVIEIYGSVQSNVVKINRMAVNLRNVVVTDGSIKSVCPKYNYIFVDEGLYTIRAIE